MKRAFTSILFSLILCVTVSFTGCGNEFAKQEYNDNEKIAQIEDHFLMTNSVFKPIIDKP